MKKTLISLLLVVMLVFTLAVPAMASGETALAATNENIASQIVAAKAASTASVTNYVQLTEEITGDVTIDGIVYLDLAGQDISGTVTITSGALYLFDSATSDYVVTGDAYGTVANIVENGGELVRAFVTPAVFGMRHRYVTIQHNKEGESGFSSHRFYIGVTHTLLRPDSVAVDYRTAYLLDEVLLSYVQDFGGIVSITDATNGDVFGPVEAKVTDDPLVAYDDTADAAVKQNHRVIRVKNILGDEIAKWEKNSVYLSSSLCAFIRFNDGLATGEDEVVTSSQASKTFQSAVAAAQTQAAAGTLTTEQSTSLTNLYKKVAAEDETLLNTWTENSGVKMPYHCVCGASLTGTTHKLGCDTVSYLWEPFDPATTTLSASGNYYLTGEAEGTVEIASQLVMNYGSTETPAITVRLDMNGRNLSSENRAFQLWYNTSLWLCNSDPDNGGVVSAKGYNGTHSGVIQMTKNDSNNHIYMLDGVTLEQTGSNVPTYAGVMQVNGGSFDMYGGTIKGTNVVGTSTDPGNGGTIQVTGSGTMTMHDGHIYGSTLKGGQVKNSGTTIYLADGYGAAIFVQGTFTMKDGTITGGTCVKDTYTHTFTYSGTEYTKSGTLGGSGGSVYVNGTFNMEGGTITGGLAEAGSGGNVYVSSGKTFNMSGGTITLGTSGTEGATRHGGGVYINSNGVLNMTGGSITGNTATIGGGGVYVNSTGNLKISGGSITGNTAASGQESNFDINNVNGNVYASGGTIGIINVNSYQSTGGASIYVSGKPVIQKLGLGGTGTYIKLATDESGNVIGLEDGASITVDKTSGTITEANTLFEGYEKYFRCFVSTNDTSYDSNAQVLTVTSNYYCLCASNTDTHLEGCDGVKHQWTAWDLSSKTTLPTAAVGEEKYYYLTGTPKANLQDAIVGLWAGESADAQGDVKLAVDLRGKDLTIASGYRAFVFGQQATATLSITDSVGGASITNGASTTAAQGMMIWNRSTIAATLKIFGGTFDSRQVDISATSTAGSLEGAIDMIEGDTVIITGNTVIYGQNVTKGNTGEGGAINFRATNKWAGTATLKLSGDAKIYGTTVSGYGGAVNSDVSVAITMKDSAEIIGGTAPIRGGAVYMPAGGSLTMSGNAKIRDGKVVSTLEALTTGTNTWTDVQPYGGNVFCGGSPTITMSDDAQISGGSIEAKVTNAHGGNLYITSNATLTMSGNAKIIGGNAKTAQGGNLYMYNNTLNMSGSAEITGGNSGTNNANHDVFAVAAKAISLSGSAKIGYIASWFGGTTSNLITLKDEPVITALAFTGGGSNVFSKVAIDGTLGDKASIGLNMSTPKSKSVYDISTATVKENADNFTSAQGEVLYIANTGSLRLKTDEVYCLCTASKTGAAHKHGCNGDMLLWTKWTTTTALPTSGYYYLGDNVTTEVTYIGTFDVYAAGTTGDQSLALDLNGKTVNVTGGRAFVMGKLATSTLTITDSVGTGVINTKDCTSGTTAVDQGSILWVRGTGTATFNMFGGTIDASKSDTNLKTPYGGRGAIDVGTEANSLGAPGGHVVNIAGGTIKGQSITKNVKVNSDLSVTTTAFKGHGGAINLYNGTLTISGDAQIYGGTVSGNGAAIYATNSTINMLGGTVHGGTASSVGGAIFLSNTDLIMSGEAAVTDGTANYGGGVYLYSGSVTMNDSSSISGGTATTNGGAVCMEKDSVTMNDSASISGGTAVLGGSVYQLAGTVTMNDSASISGGTATNNGGALYMVDGTLTVENGASIANGVATNYGGSIYMNNGTFNLKGGSVNGGNTEETSITNAIRGGCLYVNAGTVNMTGGSITGGAVAVASGESYGGNVYNAGTFNMSGDAQITEGINNGGTTNAHAGNVYNAGTFNMSGNAQVTNGHANKAQAGNVYNAGTFNMSGNAQVTGGEAAVNEQISGDIFIVGGKVYMDGGHIGAASVTNTGTTINTVMSVKGAAKVDALNLGKYPATNPCANMTLAGALTEGACINIRTVAGETIIPRGEIAADTWATYEAYLSDGKLNSANANVLQFTDDGIIGAAAGQYMYHCVCGSTTETHLPYCDGTKHLWEKWTKDNLPNTTGYWFMSDESKTYTTAYVAGDGTDIHIDLNGKTINYDTRAFRFDNVKDSATINNQYLTITDSVGGGSLNITSSLNNHSSLMMAYHNNSTDKVTPKVTFTLYGGHLNASAANCTGSWATKGAINIGANATINLYGGKITGQTVAGYGAAGSESIKRGQGGAIYLTAGSNMVMSGDAEIVGGAVPENGGAIYMETNTSLTMSGNATIRDGEVTGSSKDNTHGGNIFAVGGTTLTMSGNAKIIDGSALNTNEGKSAQGGNIYTNGILNVSGNAQITGGACDTGNDAEPITTASNADIFVVGTTAQLNVSGGQIGRINCGGGVGQVNLSGTAKISYLRLSNVWLAEISAALTEGADVAFGCDADKMIIARPEGLSDADWNAYGDYISAGYLASANANKLVLETDGIYMRAASNTNGAILYHCVCGANDGASVTADHLGDCDGTVEAWYAWTSATMPNQDGNWYLASAATSYSTAVIGEWVSTKATAEDPSMEIAVDLNGKSITMKNNNRILSIGKLSKATLTLTDSVGGGKIASGATEEGDQAILFWNRSGLQNNLNVYNVTLDASAHKNDGRNGGQGAIQLGADAVINLYGETVIKGMKVLRQARKYTDIKDDTGKVTSTTVEELYDANGQIYYTGRGGTFYLDAGSELNVYDDTIIYGGTVAEMGGAIFMAGNTTVTLNDNATIRDGKLTAFDVDGSCHGGNIYVSANAALILNDNAQILNGSAVNTYDVTPDGGSRITSGSFGGNIFVAGVLEINDNAKVLDGSCEQLTTDTTASTTAIRADIYAWGADASVTIADSAQVGYVCVLGDDGQLQAGGAVQITSLYNEWPLKLFSALTDGASINFTASKDTLLIDRADMTDAAWQVYADYISSGKLTISEGNFMLLQDATGIWARAIKDAEGKDIVYQCLCTSNSIAAADHPEGCDGKQHAWTEWTSTTALPTDDGYYYLSANVKPSTTNIGTAESFNAETAVASKNVAIDLNGKSIDGSGAFRVFVLGNSKNTTLTVTDSVGGGVITTRDCTTSGYTDQGAFLWNRSSLASTVNIYNVTVDASKSDTNLKTQHGGHGAIEIGINGGTGGNALNIFNSTIKGQNISKNVYVNSDLTVDENTPFYGHGGAISIKGGKVTISGNSHIIGGNVTGDGSAIYLVNSTLNLIDSTVTAGKATNGTDIYSVNSVVNLDGAVSINGTFGDSANKPLNLGENFTVANEGFDVKTDLSSGCIARSSETVAKACVSKITANGAKLEAHVTGLYILTDREADTLYMGYGEASLDPTANQLSYAQAGYLNSGNLSPLPIMGYGTYKAGTSLYKYDGDEYALYATAVAFADNEDASIVISVDGTSLGNGNALEIREEIKKSTGVPADNIIISMTHAHSTPALYGYVDYYEYVTINYFNKSNYSGKRLFQATSDGKLAKENGTVVEITLDSLNIKLWSDANAFVKVDNLDEAYWTTYKRGVVQAAIDAYADMKAVTGVSYATVADVNGTTDSTTVYNAVRNYEVFNSNNEKIGMYTPNHIDYVESEASYRKSESDVDDDLQLVKYTRDGQQDVIIANFQAHPLLDSGSTKQVLHSDVAGGFRNALESKLENTQVVYFSGASGNVMPGTEENYTLANGALKNSLNVKDTDGDGRKADDWGDGLATMAVAANYTSIDNFSTNVSAVKRTVTYDKMREDYFDGKFSSKTAAERNAKALELAELGIVGKLEDDLISSANVTREELNTVWGIYSSYHVNKIISRYKEVDLGGGSAKGNIELFAISVGDISFTGSPYEMFDSNGKELKTGTVGLTTYTDLDLEQKENPFKMTIVTTCANGGYGYIPSMIGFEHGGYSTDISPFAEGSGELLVTNFLDMLNGLHTAATAE